MLTLLSIITIICYLGAGVDIPPEGVLVQFNNYGSGRCILDRDSLGASIINSGTTASCCITCDDQLFKLIKHPTLDAYKIVNFKTGFVIKNHIVSSTSNSFVFATTLDSEINQASSLIYWKLIPKSSSQPNMFKLQSLATGRVMFSASDGTFNAVPDEDLTAVYWTMIYETGDVTGVSFEIDLGQIVADTPFAAGGGSCDNSHGSSADQTLHVSNSKTVTETNTFERTSGFEISIGAKFEAKVPFVGGAEISSELTTSHEFTFGEENSIATTFEAQYSITCAQGEIVEARCAVFQAQLEVPFIITLKGRKSGLDYYTYGIWSGTSAHNFDCDFYLVQ